MKSVFILVIFLLGSNFIHSQCCDTSRCVISQFTIQEKGNNKNITFYTSGRYCYGRTPYPSNLFDSLKVIPVHKAINKACKIPFFEPLSVTLYIASNPDDSYWQIRSQHKVRGQTAIGKVNYRVVTINAITGKIKKVKRQRTTAILHPYR